jgi:hypothetical protein
MSSKDPPSLEGFIQTKGASRPDAMQQRGTAQPAPELEVAKPAVSVRSPQTQEPRAKALTLRLSESQYQRLRRFAFDRGLSHQDVLEQALMELLGQSGG